MNIIAYIVSAVTLAITVILLTYTIIPLATKTIKLDNKKTIIWFTSILVIALLEIISISIALVGETSEYVAQAPGYIWLIFKVFSLLLLWVWSFCYFFFWIKFKQNKKN